MNLVGELVNASNLDFIRSGLGEANFIKSGQVTVISQSPNHKTICVLEPYTITFETGNIIYVSIHNSRISQNVHVYPH